MIYFDGREAFSRNLGWVTESEAQRLSEARVAIAGVGGVGGHYAEMLARLGVCRFTLADFDRFELGNFNRQNGSGISSLGTPKLDIIKRRILDINPTAEIREFREGIDRDNVALFLEGADLYLDGLDFFALKERGWLFRCLREQNKTGITVAPIGMGASAIVFTPQSMSFADYFGFDDATSDTEQAVRFLAGLAPSLMQRHYLADPLRADLVNRKLPSTPMGCYLCAGVAGTLALKVLLHRGPVRAAPWSLHFDSYLEKYKTTYLWAGARNPLQFINRWFIKRTLKLASSPTPLLPTRRWEPRMPVRLTGRLNFQVIEVVNVSLHGLGILTPTMTTMVDFPKFLEVDLDAQTTVTLPVRREWCQPHRAGLSIEEVPESWCQFVGSLAPEGWAEQP